jgi:CBS domain-containing protein
MRVKHVMSTPVMTVGRKEGLHVAQAIMRQSGSRHLPVVADGELIGIITGRDLHRVADVLSDGSEEAAARARISLVEEVMSRTIVTVGPETPLPHAAELMLKNAGCPNLRRVSVAHRAPGADPSFLPACPPSPWCVEVRRCIQASPARRLPIPTWMDASSPSEATIRAPPSTGCRSFASLIAREARALSSRPLTPGARRVRP